MCGIIGFYGFEDKALIKKMANIISYRGPDQEGYFFDKNLCFGHKRLSILDLSIKGKQPMTSKNGTTIIYNGEVYNFKEIREELIKIGYRFKSNSDTEVVLYSYEEWGVSCLQKFNGFFAFAIWDPKIKIIFLARDRLGIKPLYYSSTKDYFMFGSEIKSLLQYEEFERKINWTAIDSFLTIRYIPNNLTPIENIYKLDPGDYIIFNTKNKELQIKKYWDINYSENNLSLKQTTDKLDKLMDESVKLRMISDVPVGGFIGGGIDSTTIINYMHKHSNKPIETFTLGFENADEVNEYNYAKEVADYFNTNHHEIEMKASDITLLPKVIWHLDEPMADPNSIPLYILTKEAKKKVTVVLTGEGGDEIFGGYEQYKIMQKINNYSKFIPIGIGSKTIPINSFLNKLFTFASKLENQPKSYVELLAVFNDLEKSKLYTKDTKEKIKEDYINNLIKKYFSNNTSLLNKMLLTDTKTLLPENLLINLDKIGMANSLEGRVPFLDYRIVEFAATIPSKLKLNGSNEKYILKKSMERKVPKSITNRKKHRFHVPLDNWYNLYLKDFGEKLLSEKEIKKYNYFENNQVKKLLNYRNSLSYKTVLKHNELTKLYYTRQLWSLFVFSIWNKLFIEGNISNPKTRMEKLIE